MNFSKNHMRVVEKSEGVTHAVAPIMPHLKTKKSHTLVEGEKKIR